jgi:hypothetical protein
MEEVTTASTSRTIQYSARRDRDSIKPVMGVSLWPEVRIEDHSLLTATYLTTALCLLILYIDNVRSLSNPLAINKHQKLCTVTSTSGLNSPNSGKDYDMLMMMVMVMMVVVVI